ncbi:MAG: hotdog domain-containing protein [Chloroflexota bacterium]
MIDSTALKDSGTASALHELIAGKALSSQRYLYYADLAQDAGLEQTADILRASARSEAEHARQGIAYLEGTADAIAYLEATASEKRVRANETYPAFVQRAESESFSEVAGYFRDVAAAEEKQESLLTFLREALKHGQTLEGRTVAHSAVDMAQIMLPDQANVAGYVHGGELMKMMDNAAWVVACRHARKNAVTANVEEMNFHSRVRVGDLVLMHARITYAGRSSMEVRIDVETEDLVTGRHVEALTAYFTTVAINAHGAPSPVPPLIVTTDEEARLFEEGRLRHQAKRNRRKSS